MADNAPIVIADGESTPVDHTFDPNGSENGAFQYANFDVAFVDGRESLSLKHSRKAKLREFVGTLIVPRVLDESINGVTVSRVADFATLKVIGLFPTTWEEQDLKNVRVLGSNMLLDAIPADMIDRGEIVW